MNKKVLISSIIIIFFIFSNCSVSIASDFSWNKIEDQSKNFINTGKSNPGEVSTIDSNSLQVRNVINTIGQILTTIGIGVLLVTILVLGIKYMVAEPNEAAKIKKQAIGLAISGIVLLGAYNIWVVLYNLMNRVVG